MARQARRKAARGKKRAQPKCSYANCKHKKEALIPCERPGLCPHFLHECCNKGGEQLLCSQCSKDSREKRAHDKTPVDVDRNTRSVAKRSRIGHDDPTRVNLFAQPPADTSVSPAHSGQVDNIIRSPDFSGQPVTTAAAAIPETPENNCVTTATTGTPVRRRRNGGTGPVAAPAYVPGSGQVADPFQKKYNKDPKRSVVRQFDKVKYGTRQRRKAKALDHFFAVTQRERNRVDGAESTVTQEDIETAFGNCMPKQRRYKYRGHESCNILQELLMTLMWYKCAYTFDDLASKWLGERDDVARRAAQNICITWTAFFFEILKVEPLWISPERADMIRPPAFATAVAEHVGHLSDATNLGG